MNHLRLLSSFVLLAGALGCHAQKLSPADARRVEVLIRNKFNVPAYYDVTIGERRKSEMPGFDTVTVTFTNLEAEQNAAATKNFDFLLSQDGKTFAQLNRYDIPQDPGAGISDGNRPSRGGPASAPVHIVIYDDLQCPFCARMHAQLFPAILERYGDKVHIVYKDFPLGQHPWAVHAAVDANCLAEQSAPGYWSLVDNVHAHYADVPPLKPSADKDAKPADAVKPATDLLDKWTRDEAVKEKVNLEKLNACIAKQDDSAVTASIKEGDSLGVDATPQLFINGERLAGALPLKYVYKMIDGALLAAGVTPPPAPADPPAAQKPAGN
ncbi:hypothetical protein FTW19_02090 [Terriglobus albidus]|uniref:Thioredoxin-like fold domain-containing protein n=1 Tax=Terriglobus albidus TaxID=1592106 RepID=A0A5B9E534_9BACT|nr:thioredoxin domain-containing protein [Terriglobus albidus]QEE26899.1 hypothetical protein FTW19_02090 [Terriglobus albidus]